MKRITLSLLFAYLFAVLNSQSPLIINHSCTNLYKIPADWIAAASSNLHIVYGHSSHGSQLISGMVGLYIKYGSEFAFADGGLGGALDLCNYFVTGDLGYPDFTAWESLTRTYLTTHSEVNVVIWSWCGQLSWAPEDSVIKYLGLMDKLEHDYPGISFVYMTGHLDGSGISGILNVNNERIRTYCMNNNKILYDFADIESYDPDGLIDYMALFSTDSCYYDSDGNGTRNSSWAIQWSNTHPDSCFYQGECAHSHSLNCQQKGKAAWWLWARLAGWSGPETVVPVAAITVSGSGGLSAINTDKGTLQLNAEVTPIGATNKSISWTIVNGTGQASIGASGLVTAVANGTVTATAAATDGSGVSGSLLITISNQGTQTGLDYTSIELLSITQDDLELRVQLNDNNKIRTLALYNLLGNMLIKESAISNTFVLNISSLAEGYYLLVLSNAVNQRVFRVVKHQ